MTVVRRYEHPHLVGLHTVEPLEDGRVALACSAPDAVLVLDLASGEVERTLRLPAALYGVGYDLEGADLRRHAIPDEGQTTHVNAAHRAGASGLVVSTLIQGAIGRFDLTAGADGAYEELLPRLRRLPRRAGGARRGRSISPTSALPALLVFLTADGRIARRFATGSRWLHDAQQIAGSVYAFALADRNELRLYDVATGELLARRPFLRWPLPGLFGMAAAFPGVAGEQRAGDGVFEVRQEQGTRGTAGTPGTQGQAPAVPVVP